MITAQTKLFAVIGYPIKHSLSPLIHNAWFKEKNLDCKYLAFEVKPENLKKAFDAFKILGFGGINVTLPHKVAALNFADVLDASAKNAGGLNTVVFKNGRAFGYNTDCGGFIKDLKANRISARNKNIFVYGAGGAAKAVIYALKINGAKKITAANRTREKAAELAKKFKISAANEKQIPNALLEADIIVNASSCGMDKKDVLPFKAQKPKKTAVVYDLIYNKNTPFKKFAKVFGLKYFSAEGMLIRQGAEAFKIWTGKQPDIETAQKALRGKL